MNRQFTIVELVELCTSKNMKDLTNEELNDISEYLSQLSADKEKVISDAEWLQITNTDSIRLAMIYGYVHQFVNYIKGIRLLKNNLKITR